MRLKVLILYELQACNITVLAAMEHKISAKTEQFHTFHYITGFFLKIKTSRPEAKSIIYPPEAFGYLYAPYQFFSLHRSTFLRWPLKFPIVSFYLSSFSHYIFI